MFEIKVIFDKLKKILIFIIFFICMEIAGDNFSENYEIAVWKDFKKSAVVFTFDDWTPNQFEVVIPMFNEFGYKATFYPVVNWIYDWSKLKTASEYGHEIGSHSMTHRQFNTLSLVEQEKELYNSQNIINYYISQRCLTIAYPFGIQPEQHLENKYYIGGRGVIMGIEDKTPKDIFNIKVIGCGENGVVNTEESFKEYLNKTLTLEGLCVFLLHGIDGDGGYSPVKSSILRNVLQYLKENEDKFWVTTLQDAILYIKERDETFIKVMSQTQNSIKFLLTNNLDKNIYNFPLTIKVRLPKNWKKIELRKNGKTLNSKIVRKDESEYIIFDAIPEENEIILSTQD